MIYSLNGTWEVGIDQRYEKTAAVPGLPYAAGAIPDGNVWYRKRVELPEYTCRNVTLLLHGAKYAPGVYINGTKVSETEGGMTKTVHPLRHPDIGPGGRVELAVCLKTLNTMDAADASCMPPSDRWRSTITSHIWNDVELVFHNRVRMEFMVPEYENGRAFIRYKAAAEETGCPLQFELYDGEECIGRYAGEAEEYGRAALSLSAPLVLWCPETPKLYRLVCRADGAEWEQAVGFKTLEIRGKHFLLNGKPVVLRMGSVVWHRAYRDPQFPPLAYNTEWFYENIVKRLLDKGANTLRFHLGNPPRKILELCDKYGLLVQTEWGFFHEADAAVESMERQYETWIGESLSHASVAVLHPWNEVDDKSRHSVIIEAIEKSDAHFPKYLLSHRDIIHVHAYWWSIFENLGLYFDSYDQFEKPVIADEFGGNYLDYNGDEGSYVTIKETMRRFLGENATRGDRVWLHTVSNGKVAEYWRRIGVAGFSPFVILSSPEDGNTHFFGTLENPTPMPVWDALAPAYAPLAVSMDIWDRNFEAGEIREVPLYLFNDTEREETVTVTYGVGDFSDSFQKTLQPFSKEVVNVTYKMPEEAGEWVLHAAIGEAVSAWDIFVHKMYIPETERVVGAIAEETELLAFLRECGIRHTTDLSACDTILGMAATYEKLKTDPELLETLADHIHSGKKAALLSLGPQELGQQHPERPNAGIAAENKALDSLPLFDGLQLRFVPFPEGESHVHPVCSDDALWNGIPRKSLWLWNGLRGGLIVPAVNMDVEGASGEAFVSLWKCRGADEEALKKEKYYAFECMGLYEFGTDETTGIEEKLLNRVQFLLDDAPALKNAGYTPHITRYDLAASYREKQKNQNICRPVVRAGKGLNRVPAVSVSMGEGELLLSEILFEGRLMGTGKKGREFAHRDCIARQMVLNLI